jgi:hypothetical protein
LHPLPALTTSHANWPLLIWLSSSAVATTSDRRPFSNQSHCSPGIRHR